MTRRNNPYQYAYRIATKSARDAHIRHYKKQGYGVKTRLVGKSGRANEYAVYVTKNKLAKHTRATPKKRATPTKRSRPASKKGIWQKYFG